MAVFDWFVVFAEMRTGSNFLEANLNRLDGVTCHGELFNPHFIGYPGRDQMLGVPRAAREAEPFTLLQRVQEAGGLHGFRYFHDHDPRILERVLDDPRCAKIILTRNPADSYVSLKIAQATDQWKLTDVNRRRTAKAWFEPAEFDRHMADLQSFQVALLNGLQKRGQTAFYIGHDDLNTLDVFNGLARWLGAPARLKKLDTGLKRQNPEPARTKVENFDDMERTLAHYDRFDLTRTPNLEPRRGPMVPGYVAATRSPLLYLPIGGGPDDRILSWMAALDGGRVEDLERGFSQKTLRRWLRGHPGHRRFTALRHPVARAHAVFCERVLSTAPEAYTRLRHLLVKHHELQIPKDGASAEGYDAEAHRRAFKAFLAFLKRNLDQQTSIRVDPLWCSQTAALKGFGEFVLPDAVLREGHLETALPALAESAGCRDVPPVPPEHNDHPYALAEIYDVEIEKAARDAYPRDYLMFGFSDWEPASPVGGCQAALTRSASVRIV